MDNTGTTDWDTTDIPNCKGKKIHILKGAMYGQVVRLFAEAGFVKSEGVSDADLVVFTGGTDVDPSLYKQKPIKEVIHTDRNRDIFEEAIYRMCVKRKIPMVGICRGAQFLHVMNGGVLWQDVNHHAGKNHTMVDIMDDVRIETSSLHHQMMQFNTDMELLAVTEETIATTYKDADCFINLSRDDPRGAPSRLEPPLEIEACYYRDTKCFLVQGHPEVGPNLFASWFMHKLFDFMFEELDKNNSDNNSEETVREVAEAVAKMIG